MAALNFTPDSPSNGDTFTANGVTYTYDGTKWKTSIVSNDFFPNTGGTVSGNIVLDGELQHSGDTDTKLHFDTDTIKLDTAGSERFRVGSAGQLGIGGATYGSDGQVLTSTGASSAPAWEAIPTPEGVWTEGQTLTFTSASSITWTGIPTDAKFIRLVFQNVTVDNSTTPHIAMRFGNGGTPDSAGNYDWRLYDFNSAATEGNNSTSDIRITHGNHSATAHRWYGIIDVHCIDNEHTSVSIQSWSRYSGTTNHLEYGAGRWTAGSDLDRIMLFKPSGHNYTGGRGTVYYAT